MSGLNLLILLVEAIHGPIKYSPIGINEIFIYSYSEWLMERQTNEHTGKLPTLIKD